jgi:hypothetical protein
MVKQRTTTKQQATRNRGQVVTMGVKDQMATCSRQYSKWKELALDAETIPELKMCLRKAMFWMELHTAFMALWSIEQVRGDDSDTKKKLIIAKSNLSKRLADYAENILDEISRVR